MNNISIVQVVDIFNALHIDSAMQICDDQLNFRFVGNKLLETVDCTTNSVLDKKLVDIKTPVQHLAKESMHQYLRKKSVKQTIQPIIHKTVS